MVICLLITPRFKNGEWENDKFHGYGVYKNNVGGTYEGEYRDGKRHGQGTYRNSAKELWEGTWANGSLNGYAIYRPDPYSTEPYAGKNSKNRYK